MRSFYCFRWCVIAGLLKYAVCDGSSENGQSNLDSDYTEIVKKSEFLNDWSNVSFKADNIETDANNTREYSWLEQINPKNLKHSIFYTVPLIIAYAAVFVVGVFGNSVVISVISFRAHMRTVTNLFLLNLAVADMFVLFVCLPATLLASILKPWILGSLLCWGVTYVQGVSVVASAYSLVGISVDRCRVICRDSTSSGGFSLVQTKTVIGLIWIIALLVPLPWAFVFELSVVNSYTVCTENWDFEEMDTFYFIVGNLFCCYLLPLLLICIANVKIWRKVSHRTVPQSDIYTLQNSRHIQQAHRKTKRGVGKMLGLVTFTFLLSWMPLYILACRVKLTRSFGDLEKKVLWNVVPLAQWLGYWNSCVNPIYYAFFNSNFREMSKSFLPSWIVDGILEWCVATRGHETKTKLQGFVHNSRYEHGILEPAIRTRQKSARDKTRIRGCNRKGKSTLEI